MKILFLDIDGVVNSRATTNFKDLWPLDPYMAFLVGKIEIYTGCKVVLSSSWRHHPEAIGIVEKAIVPIYDTTPLSGSGIRGDEIKQWLDNHPDVTKYAILDDDSDMLSEQLPNFFKTTFDYGLTDEIANKVMEHLGNES